ncbi:metal ABC transporter substrate-binding protein [Wukongibacter baidiensis]|uniref:metal ABC transporter substrate-binding protein n=1 Tax=Wukongibacter baidiensis TaxID=1723361 RepID=UPI003D7F5DA9
MKKVLSILLVSLLIFISACSNNAKPQSESTAKEISRVEVYASIYPMYYLAKEIGKDKIDLELMVPPGAEPHDWEPTAKLMAKMEKADIFIYNGVQMEMWADRVIGALSNKELIVVEASEGIDLLKLEEHSGEHEENGEEHKDEHEDEKHEGEEHEDDHGHGEYDPHVWLDPIRAIEQAKNIKDALVKADGENREFYEANFNQLSDKLKGLDDRIRDELKDRKMDEIVVAHAAFGYLADRYGLKQVAISGLTPQEEPSAFKMAEITELVKEHGVKYIFYESLTSPKLSQVLAKETGAQTAVLNPIGGLPKEDIEAGKDYISIMEENLESLKKALY